MFLFNCDICKISTNLKSNHKRHLLTKKHLKKLEGLTLKNTKEHKKNTKEHKKNTKEHKISTNPSNKFSCQYCDDTFNTFSSMRRHEIHYCKLNLSNNTPIISHTIKIMESKHDKEKKQLYKQINKLIDKTGNTTYNSQTNTQNIKLNGFGKEDLSHITDSFKTQLLNGPYGMIPKMIEQVHFSEDKPENKNISLTNSRDNKMKVFTGDKWVYKNKDEIIHDLMDGKYFIMDTHYESICENLNDINQSRYATFRDFFDDREKKMYEQQKKDCELVLLNNR